MRVVTLTFLSNHIINFITVVTGLMLSHAHCKIFRVYWEVDVYVQLLDLI